jgi:hypothetical protein
LGVGRGRCRFGSNGSTALAKSAGLAYDHGNKGRFQMSRSNILYLVVGALVVVVGVLGYQLYEDKKKPEGVNINLGPGGISIQKK